MHRAHRELTVRAAREQKCNILIHPVVGLTKPGDIDHYTRVRVYKALLPKYPQGMAALSLLPLAMRMGGPREAVWHAIIRKNFGCTHFIVGRDHAGPGKDSNGNDFYGPYDAQDLVEEYRDELHITVVPFQMVSYVPDTDEYVPSDKLQPGTKTLNISGTELRRRLKTGAPIPDWFTYPEVQQILRSVHPPRSRQGFVVLVVGADQWATGVVGRALENVLNQSGQRAVTLLAREIGASLHAGISSPSAGSSSDKAVESVAFVAGEIAKAGGAVVVATDLPTERARKIVRDAVESRGGAVITAFITDTPDSGESFFEAPAGTPEVVANARVSVSQAVHEVVLELEREGFVGER
nr:Sulfate adenylyltransferase [Polyrhizophydium stewartii]